eukprot:6427320-Amphidinium_carterae.1
MGAHCSLAAFVRSSFASRASLASSASIDDLFPCALPSRLLCRTSLEDRRASIARDVLRAIVSILNYCALGFHGDSIGDALLGMSVSSDQTTMLARLESWVLVHVCAPAEEPSSLGRAFDKMTQLTHSIASIRHLLGELSKDGHYCSVSVPGSVACNAKPLNADRVKWPLGASFDPTPYLDYDDLPRAYADPSELLVDQTRVHASRGELLKLLGKWDKAGVLRVVPASTVDRMVRLGLFTVFKDHDYDRLILNPSVRNSRCRQLSLYTKFLPAGYLLCALHLEPNEVLRISSDDLREYYYTFKVSEKRAHANAIGCKFWGSELAHLAACPASLASTRVLPCLATLAMGDALAPEAAQCAHWRLIEHECGGMLPAHLVGNRLLIPRGPLYECLTYDDHCTLFRMPASAPPGLARPDLELHARCDHVYPFVGLHPHVGKRIRDADVAQVLGATVNGDLGYVHAPSLRTLVLLRLTLEVVRLGQIDITSLSMLVGCWVHVCMYRRPLLCLLHETYLLLAAWADQPHRLVRLRDRVKNELVAISTLSLIVGRGRFEGSLLPLALWD